MKPAMRNENPHLERACWLVVNEHENLYGSPPTGLYFNKALSLLNKRLKDKGLDLRLPHCWYRYGDEVVRFWMPNQVVMENDVQTQVLWTGPEPPQLKDRLGKTMTKTLDGVLKEFHSTENIQDMVDKVYGYAPFEFQRAYRRVRHVHFDAGHSLLDQRNLADLLRSFIKSAAVEFPHDEFPLASYYAKCVFKSSVKTLERDETKLALVKEVLESFWEHWCYHLRIHPKGHENVPESTLKMWRDELVPQEKEYARVFLEHLSAMMEAAPGLKDDNLFAPWVARLETSEEDARAHIDDWSSVMEGVDEFVQRQKPGFGAS